MQHASLSGKVEKISEMIGKKEEKEKKESKESFD